tara:strand:- start:230 stop:364 length:135 start_codon:yes stop_codon:yes gene_type:complete
MSITTSSTFAKTAETVFLIDPQAIITETLYLFASILNWAKVTKF